MRRFATMGIVIVSAVSAVSVAGAAPMTNDMDLVYGKYQMAIRAAQLCRGAPDTDAVWRKWSGYLDAKTNYELGAGDRLAIIEGVKMDVTRMVRRQGCHSNAIKDLLTLYDAELAGLAKP